MVSLISAVKPPEPQTFPIFSLLYIHSLVDFYQRNGVPRYKHSGEVKVFPAREHVRSWFSMAKSLLLNIPMGLGMGPAAHLSSSRQTKLRTEASSELANVDPQSNLPGETSCHNPDCSTEVRPKSLLNFFLPQKSLFITDYIFWDRKLPVFTVEGDAAASTKLGTFPN